MKKLMVVILMILFVVSAICGLKKSVEIGKHTDLCTLKVETVNDEYYICVPITK